MKARKSNVTLECSKNYPVYLVRSYVGAPGDGWSHCPGGGGLETIEIVNEKEFPLQKAHWESPAEVLLSLFKIT